MSKFTFVRWTSAGYVPEPSVGAIEAATPEAAILLAEQKWRAENPPVAGERRPVQLLPMPADD